MVWTAPATWVANDPVPAADLNVQLRDNLKAIGDPWTDWTPVWTAATTAVALGNGTLIGRYMNAGKLVAFIICLTAGSTTTFGTGQWRMTVPFTPKTQHWRWSAACWDSSANATYPAGLYMLPLGTIAVLTPNATAGNAERSVSNTVPFTWATGDILTIHGTYEAV